MYKYFPKRYIVTALTFLGFVVMFYLRTNLSIAIVAMTDDRNITVGNETLFEEAEFDWDSKDKGFILGSFSYGYFLAPLGGILANKFGGATIFGFGQLITALFTIMSPIFFRLNFYVFIAARVCEGAFEAFSVSSSAELFARWSPPNERARIMMYSHSGVFVGTAINYPISGFVAHHFGWEAIFYLSGAVSIVWYVFWVMLVSNDPSEDKYITAAEKAYLKEKINYFTTDKKVAYPWKKILTSPPIWAYAFHRFAHAWSFAFTVFCLPWYIKDLHEVDLNRIGILSSIPNLCTIIVQPIAATILDHLRARKVLSTTQLHKIFSCGSYVLAVIIFMVVQSWTHFLGTIICFSVYRMAAGFGETSYNVLPLDMTPQYASLIAGIGSAFYSLGCLLSPILIGYIVTQHKHSQWNHYFLILSIINAAGGLVFFFMGSGDLQSWSIPKLNENEKSTEKREAA